MDGTRVRQSSAASPGHALKADCPCGGRCPRCTVSAAHEALRIAEADSPFEQEADRLSSAMLAAPALQSRALPAHQSLIAVGRKGADVTRATDATQEITNTLTSQGSPLDIHTRAFFESRLGHDLSGVRIHTDARAASSSHAIRARAFTYGNHIVFGESQFAPASAAGQRLLAHELVHVLRHRPRRFTGRRSRELLTTARASLSRSSCPWRSLRRATRWRGKRLMRFTASWIAVGARSSRATSWQTASRVM